jgi:hypothetical protein
MKRFPSPRCASAIQIVRPWESTGDPNRTGSPLLFLAEFLEARIVSQRIEHWIERESAAEVVRKAFALLFRREGGDDFFEARIAAERVPDREQFQGAVAQHH